MESTDLLRSYMDILAEAELAPLTPPAQSTAAAEPEVAATRRVTLNPDGTTSGGWQPNPVDPNAPPRPRLTQAQRDQAEELSRQEMGLPSLASQREQLYQQQLAAYRKGDFKAAGFGFKPRQGD